MITPTALFAAIIAAAASGSAVAGDFRLTSPDIAEGHRLPNAQVYNGFGYSGGNRSPALAWVGVPAATKSFAVTVFDPDAPTGHGWWHWVVYDIPGNVAGLAAGVTSATLPAGAAEGVTDFKATGYGGAAPPPGKPHRYIFTVYALDVDRLDVPAHADGPTVTRAAARHQLAQASITALFGR